MGVFWEEQRLAAGFVASCLGGRPPSGHDPCDPLKKSSDVFVSSRLSLSSILHQRDNLEYYSCILRVNVLCDSLRVYANNNYFNLT